MDKRKKLFQYQPGETLPFGVTRVSDGVQFAVSIPGGRNCSLNLYKKGQKRPACRIELSKEYRRGSVYFVRVTDCPENVDNRSVAEVLSQDYEYMYETDGKEFIDPYATVIHGRERWGKRRSESVGMRGGISLEEFDWQGDTPLGIPYSDMILYQLHVRGFTKHISSKVAHRGTFDGLQEKIPYLKELGVNALLLLPCYEFEELRQDRRRVLGQPEDSGRMRKEQELPVAGRKAEKGDGLGRTVSDSLPKYNYWGYGAEPTYYFAPKASYASEPEHVSEEFKRMVRALHQAGIEVLMDVCFAAGTNICTMQDCLRHWVLEYHIDGFRVNQEVMPSLVLVSDPVLSSVKLLAAYWDRDMLKSAGIDGREHMLAEYNEGFMNCSRRYLKGDEGQVEGFAYYLRHNSSDVAAVNFITYVNGFTMMDLVSYDVKHNEDNGELNQDGTQYNYSWNCGTEGRSRKKVIVSRRQCQIRNAFALVLLSQGTPMILAGDEFGNTQKGNNNPYCQDNGVTWLDWGQLESQAEIFDYVRKLIAFRKEHPVLHQGKELLMFDSLSCGMPDVSIHGTQAWRADFSYYSRMLAVLLYGAYQQKQDGTQDESLYIIFNMYWESRSFDLPNLPGDKEWHLAVETYGNTFNELPEPVKRKRKRKAPSLAKQKKTVVPPRSIVVFVGR